MRLFFYIYPLKLQIIFNCSELLVYTPHCVQTAILILKTRRFSALVPGENCYTNALADWKLRIENLGAAMTVIDVSNNVEMDLNSRVFFKLCSCNVTFQRAVCEIRNHETCTTVESQRQEESGKYTIHYIHSVA